MAIVMTMRWEGVSPSDYDRAREVVGWERDPAEGGRNHVAWFDVEGVFHAVDVWDSEQAFDRFANERLMPGLASAGLLEGKPQPEIDFAPLHALWTPEAVPAAAGA